MPTVLSITRKVFNIYLCAGAASAVKVDKEPQTNQLILVDGSLEDSSQAAAESDSVAAAAASQAPLSKWKAGMKLYPFSSVLSLPIFLTCQHQMKFSRLHANV